VLKGFLLGLSNNIFCFFTCAAVFLPYTIASGQKQWKSIAQFMAGRLLAYIFFGFAAGCASVYFEGRIDPLIFSILTLLMSAWLMLFAAGKFKHKFAFCAIVAGRFSGANLPFFMGLVLGLNICPPFLIGLSETLQMASVIKPVLFFTGFYFGASLWLMIFIFTRRLASNKAVNLFAATTSFLVGVWYFWKAALQLRYFLF
jgi:hypothetical protein